MTLADAKAFVRERFGGTASEPWPLGAGEWSDAFAFDAQSSGLVVRFSRLREDFDKDVVASGFASPSLPVPRVVEIGEAFGGFYAVSERARGTHLDELDRAGMERVLPSLLDVILAEGRVEVGRSRGFGLLDGSGRARHGSWRLALLDVGTDRPGSRIHGWRPRLESQPEASSNFDGAFGRLEGLVDGVPELQHLVHSDLLHFNVLVEGEQVTAVLDWGSSLFGDSLYDLAWLQFWQPWFPAWEGIDFGAEARRRWTVAGVDLSGFEERLLCYQVHIGLDSQAYTAFAGRFADMEAAARRTLALLGL